MKKILLAALGLVVLVVGYFLYIYWALGNDSVARPTTSTSTEQTAPSAPVTGVPTLISKDWQWQSTLINDGREIVPAKPGSFVLKFESNSNFSATTDCNMIGGTYEASDDTIAFTNLFSTRMYCEGAQETMFSQFLRDTTGYHFGPNGELILDLKFDSGSVVFK